MRVVPSFSIIQSALTGLLLGWLAAPPALAEGGIRLNQTRVILQDGAKSAPAAITNKGDAPYLVKASVLTSLTPGSADQATPFMVTPPLFRLEANSRHTAVVVTQQANALPTDRESVFYLSFLAIPASPVTTHDNAEQVSAQMSIGLQSVIKLFYRPKGLSLSPHVAAKRVTFQAHRGQLVVTNSTPYYVTLSQVTVNQQPVDVHTTNPMVAPFSSAEYSAKVQVGQSVRWQAMNDYGGETEAYQGTVLAAGAQP